MIRFLGGFALVYAALYAWSIAAEFRWLGDVASGAGMLAVTMVGVPVASAWAGAELANFARPVRLFDRRIRRGRAKVVLGLAAGAMGTLLGAGLLPLLDAYVADAAILGGAGALATIILALAVPRRRAGHCIFCGYDLRDGPSPGQPGAGRCPECGAAAAT